MVSRKGQSKGVPGSKSLGGPGPRPKTSEVMSRLIKMLSKGKEKEEELGESSGESNSHIIHHELRISEIESQLNR